MFKDRGFVALVRSLLRAGRISGQDDPARSVILENLMQRDPRAIF